ncbi:MAG: response regulator, partial [Proteobacteria bacterium]|nr:response regulator [Pseudomonadota bacterium]
GVIGITELLLDTPLDHKQRHYAKLIRDSGEALLILINDILDFSKIEAGKLDLNILNFDLQSLLDDVAAMVYIQAHEKGLALLYSAEPEVPIMLRGDPGRLRQILTNLSGNAVKFTHSGEIFVHVGRVTETENDVLLRFSVRDTGIGIPKNKIGILFSKFTQVDRSTIRNCCGSGLGLAISKQLAEMMGGKIGVESQEGVGSNFWFTVRLEKQGKGANDQRQYSPGLSSMRVLIVDGVPANREILISQMRSWGLNPSEANDGKSAFTSLELALDENDPFRIIMIDMKLPDMSGEALGLAIKKDPRMAELRMLILTSMGIRGDGKHFGTLGFDGYLTRPFNNHALQTMLGMILNKKDGEKKVPPALVTHHMARESINVFSGRKISILIAEDNITNQQVALGIITKLGLNAHAVFNGADAVKALESLAYDLVFMDVQMPLMDGLEATRIIRDPTSGVLNHTIPIIAMTAYAMQGDRETCLTAGMNDYITKPVDALSMANLIETWLPPGKMADHGHGPRATSSGDMDRPLSAERRPASTPEAPLIFNWKAVLDRLMNDEELAFMVLEGFMDDIPKKILSLKNLLDTDDSKGSEMIAHTIKGAASNVGGDCLQAVALVIEKASRNGDLISAKANIQNLETQFARLKAAINDLKIISKKEVLN